MIPDDDPRRLVARLAVAVLACDRGIASAEVAALAELDHIGLGRVSDLAHEEMLRAVDEPIDVGATCAALRCLGPETCALFFAVVTRLAASDARMSPCEVEMLGTLARELGVPATEAGHMVDAALAETSAAPRARR